MIFCYHELYSNTILHCFCFDTENGTVENYTIAFGVLQIPYRDLWENFGEWSLRWVVGLWE